jgi:hypothetical protein
MTRPSVKNPCGLRLASPKVTEGCKDQPLVDSAAMTTTSKQKMISFARNAFNVVVMIFLISFIALNLFQIGKYLLSSQGLI